MAPACVSSFTVDPQRPTQLSWGCGLSFHSKQCRHSHLSCTVPRGLLPRTWRWWREPRGQGTEDPETTPDPGQLQTLKTPCTGFRLDRGQQPSHILRGEGSSVDDRPGLPAPVQDPLCSLVLAFNSAPRVSGSLVVCRKDVSRLTRDAKVTRGVCVCV